MGGNQRVAILAYEADDPLKPVWGGLRAWFPLLLLSCVGERQVPQRWPSIEGGGHGALKVTLFGIRESSSKRQLKSETSSSPVALFNKTETSPQLNLYLMPYLVKNLHSCAHTLHPPTHVWFPAGLALKPIVYASFGNAHLPVVAKTATIGGVQPKKDDEPPPPKTKTSRPLDGKRAHGRHWRSPQLRLPTGPPPARRRTAACWGPATPELTMETKSGCHPETKAGSFPRHQSSKMAETDGG